MDNTPEKKTDRQSLPELQMNTAENARIPDILTVITGAFIILALTIIMIIMPDKTFSEQENRALQQFPALSSKAGGIFPDRFFSGEFTADMVKYCADQFPFRDAFVGLKGMAEIALFKSENNGVILGKKDYLITKDSYRSIDQLRINIDAISVFADTMYEMKVPVTLAVAGRSVDALSAYLPSAYPQVNSNSLWDAFASITGIAAHVKGVDLLTPLKQLIERDDRGQLYYRTDHHWTTLGAYYAYAEIIKSFKENGVEPLPLLAFTIETASDSFYGTTWSKAGMKWIKPDAISYFRYEGDEDFVTAIADTGKYFNGFYDRSYLEVKDKYSSFIGGNNARTDISKPGDSTRPKLVLIKDSFAHAVAPFLAYHYDLIILDLRYYTESVAKLVFDEGVSRVLFLSNMDNFSEDDIYGILQYSTESALHDYIMSQYPIKKIYINSNPIDDYIIVCPTDENDGEKYYINAAELLRNTILEKTGIELEIVKTDDISGLDKYIMFTSEGLPELGFMKIAVEGNNFIFRCNIDNDEGYYVYAAKRFIERYLGRNAEGSFNFGENYMFTDAGDEIIMIMPGMK